ncbi:MAG: methyltransferase domain-containing protein [Candidatus Omnitrophica bacterium]|nr:methyltransferase domain-containing protein [Candidatus Omnitrophota bacterium]
MLLKRTLFTVFVIVSSLMGPACTRAGEEGTRFIVLGDLHFGITDQDEFREIAAVINSYGPDMVVFLGNGIDLVGERPPLDISQYDTLTAFRRGEKLNRKQMLFLDSEFREVAETIDAPVYGVTGDRNIPANNPDLAERLFLDRYGKRYYSLVMGNNLFIMLDSEQDNTAGLKQRGHISGEQLEFLRDKLEDADKYDNVFVFMHKTNWLEPSEKEKRLFDMLHRELAGRADHVFTSGEFVLDRMEKDNVTYITSGGNPNWETMKPFPSFFHFLIVDADGQDVEIKVVPLEPVKIEDLVVSQYNLARRGGSLEQKIWLDNPLRVSMLEPGDIVSAVAPDKGDAVLDLGAGTGIFTFIFAEKVGPSGKVFATETSKSLVKHIEQEAEAEGFGNIEAITVKSEGVDPFYAGHRFDIIFLCDVYELIERPVEYFSELRRSLVPGGRMFIVYYRFDSDFTPLEFRETESLKQRLGLEEEDFPLYSRLSAATVNSLRDGEGPLTGGQVAELTAELNDILDDRTLFPELVEYYGAKRTSTGKMIYRFIHPKDIALVEWLVEYLEDRDAFSPGREISPRTRKQLRRLNRISLAGIFRNTTLYDIFRVDRLGYVDDTQVISDMEKAGYEFTGRRDTLRYHYILEFKNGSPKSSRGEIHEQ